MQKPPEVISSLLLLAASTGLTLLAGEGLVRRTLALLDAGYHGDGAEPEKSVTK